jgi:hypothetical protein
MRARATAALAVSLLTGEVAANPRVETDGGLVFVFGDDDVLHGSGETVPTSPSAGIGDRDAYRLQFDGYGSPDTGRENRVEIRLSAAAPGYLPGLETSAALMLSIDWQELTRGRSEGAAVFRDEGSRIDLSLDLRGGRVLGATLFPIDTNGFRLGFVDELAWGGTRSSRGESIFPGTEGGVPGGKLYFTGRRVHAFAGLKTATLSEVAPGGVRMPETNWGFLGGISVEAGSWLRAEAEGGYFEQGRLEQAGVEGRLAYSAGASGRVILRSGRGLPSVPDFFAGAPTRDREEQFFGWGRARPRGFALAFESSGLVQRLQDFEALETTELQLARAFAVYGSADNDALEVRLGGFCREPSFVLRNAPSFPRFTTLPQALAQAPELSLSLGATLRPGRSLWIPSIDLGLRWPATLTTQGALDQLGQRVSRTLVVSGQSRLTPLEPGAGTVPVLQARLSLLLTASRQLSMLGWVMYRRDYNATRIELDAQGLARERRFVTPDFAGGGLAVRAGF